MQSFSNQTPLPLQHGRVSALKNAQDSPFLKIPASPLMKQLGYGTGVNVYLIERSPKLGQLRSPWAVKKISRKCNNASMRTYEQRLTEEAMVLKSLHHKNIVGFRGFIRDKDGSSCLAMEDGEKSLMSMIEERMEEGFGPFPARKILFTAEQIINALVYLHQEKQLLHGDLKSGNILVKGDFEEIKLCDFGVTVSLDKDLVASKDVVTYIGTQPWSSKEALEGTLISDKADIFSFGMILYEMLTLGIPHMHVFPEEENYCGDDEAFERDFEIAELEYESSLGTRPPLVNYEFDPSYTPVIELFWACTSEKPEDRPSAVNLAKSFEEFFENSALIMPDPRCKLEF